MLTSKFVKNLFFSSIFSFIIGACSSQFSKARTVKPTSYPAVFNRVKKDHRFSIMQSGINFYTIKSIEVDHSKQQFTVTLDKLDSIKTVYFKNQQSSSNSIKAGEERQLHLYMKDSTSYSLDEPHTILLERVARVALVN